MVWYVIRSILNPLKGAVYLGDSEIKTRTNIWVSKEYLNRFCSKSKPSWVSFCEDLIDKGFEVFLYLPEKLTSVYVTMVKNCKMQTVRFSNHPTKEEKWLRSDVDYYIGPSKLGMLSCQEVLDALNIYFR